MVVHTVTCIGADVHGGGELRHIVKQTMMSLGGDRVRIHDSQSGVDDNPGLCPNTVTDPTQFQALHFEYARGRRQGCLGNGEHLRIDGIHEPPVNVSGGPCEYQQGCSADPNRMDLQNANYGPWRAHRTEPVQALVC